MTDKVIRWRAEAIHDTMGLCLSDLAQGHEPDEEFKQALRDAQTMASTIIDILGTAQLVHRTVLVRAPDGESIRKEIVHRLVEDPVGR